MNRRNWDRQKRREILERSLEPDQRGGITTAGAKLMATTPKLGGKLAECTIVGHCRTSVFEFPASYLVAEEPVDHQIIYSQAGFKAAIVSHLPAYFEQKTAESRHYSIDVSLRAGIRSTYEKAIKNCNRRTDPVVPLFLVIEEYAEIPPTMLNNGECFTIDEFHDGVAMVEGGREGERAFVAIRTVDGSWPDFRANMHMANVVLVAVKVEQNFTGHMEKLYSTSCFASSTGQAVHPLSPRFGPVSAQALSRLEPPELEEKVGRLASTLQVMMEDSEPVAAELFDSVLLDKTKDDNYLRLTYLRLWEALDDAIRSARFRDILRQMGCRQLWNTQVPIAGQKTPKDLYGHRKDIAHWNTGRADVSYLTALQKTALALLRKKYGANNDG